MMNECFVLAITLRLRDDDFRVAQESRKQLKCREWAQAKKFVMKVPVPFHDRLTSLFISLAYANGIKIISTADNRSEWRNDVSLERPTKTNDCEIILFSSIWASFWLRSPSHSRKLRNYFNCFSVEIFSSQKFQLFFFFHRNSRVVLYLVMANLGVEEKPIV